MIDNQGVDLQYFTHHKSPFTSKTLFEFISVMLEADTYSETLLNDSIYWNNRHSPVYGDGYMESIDEMSKPYTSLSKSTGGVGETLILDILENIRIKCAHSMTTCKAPVPASSNLLIK